MWNIIFQLGVTEIDPFMIELPDEFESKDEELCEKIRRYSGAKYVRLRRIRYRKGFFSMLSCRFTFQFTGHWNLRHSFSSYKCFTSLFQHLAAILFMIFITNFLFWSFYQTFILTLSKLHVLENAFKCSEPVRIQEGGCRHTPQIHKENL